MRKSAAVAADDDYLGQHHVYEPHRAGLPKMRPYFRELWRRREFATEMAATTIRSSHSDSVLGIMWNILNPLLLAGVYYLLVIVISGSKQRPDYFPHLLGGLFLFYFLQSCMLGGASSVISAGKIVMNTAFPRMLLPLSAVWIAFRKFLPTMVIYFAAALLSSGVHFRWVNFLAIPMLLLVLVFGTGLSMMLATAQVYFRDTSSFLPYFTRLWLYASPVLYYPDMYPRHIKPFAALNPLTSLLGGWGDLLVKGVAISPLMWLEAIAWSLAALVFGGLFFMSRERDFAVRL